jgi:hypothetical protein
MAARSNRNSTVIHGIECENWPRRNRLEADDLAWLRWYLPGAFSREFDEPHREIISGINNALDTGGRFVVAGERGIGKSVPIWGMALKLALTERCRLPVYIPWAARDLKRAFRFWRDALCHNKRLLADYRWTCAPFAHSKGMPQRFAAQHWDHNGQPCGATLQVGDGIITFPDSKGGIGGATMNGQPRGLNFPLPDGSVLRPSIAIMDDVQDRKVAKSPTLADDICHRIDNDVAGMAGAGAAFPLLMAGNCMMSDDVMARYLNDDKWAALRIPCIKVWPDEWEKNGDTFKLWKEWWSEYQHDARDGLRFYKKHKATLTKNMELSSPNAYKEKTEPTLPDIYTVAMRQYFQMGHDAFMAERQQTPLSPDEMAPFTLTVAIICSRADEDREPHQIPQHIKTVIASTDINDYALSTVVVGYGNDQTAAVLWYGQHDNGGRGVMESGAPEAVKVRQLFDALVKHGEWLGGCGSNPFVWGIDAGYLGPTVRRYADTIGRRCGMQVILCRGLDGQRYRPGWKAIGKPAEMCHMTDWPQIGRGLAWNSHYWHEIMQRAWLGDIGRPGSCSLFRGEHRNFAEHIWRERLLGRGEVGGKQVWTFARQPGPHDYGDAMAQCYALAAYGGIGTSGQVMRRKKYVEKRKPKARTL